jgi:hypothetical protein
MVATCRRPRIFQHGSANAKLAHGNRKWEILTLSLAASDSAGVNLCPKAMPLSRIVELLSDGYSIREISDIAATLGLSMCSYLCCVNRAGRGVMSNVQGARANLTRWFAEDRPGFCAAMVEDLWRHHKRSVRGRFDLGCRPNTNSDVQWERVNPEMFNIPMEFYDYTKLSHRLGKTPDNYHLVYSVSDATTLEDWGRVHATGSSVAVVFDVDYQPSGAAENRYYGVLPNDWTDPTGYRWRVVDGDAYDARFLDDPRVCVGLRLKGSILGRECGRLCGFADTRFSGGLVTSLHPSEV